MKYVKCRSKIGNYWYTAAIPRTWQFSENDDVEITENEFNCLNKHELECHIVMGDGPKSLYIIIPDGFMINPHSISTELIRKDAK